MLRQPQLALLSTAAGKPTGGVFGALKSLRSTLSALPEVTKAIVVFDGGHSKRRLELYPEYKGNREKKRAEEEVESDGLKYTDRFHLQLNYCKFLLPRMNLRVVCLSGKEGDDVVGMLASKLPDDLKVIMSDDKDMFQCVSETVQLWRPLASERVTVQNFEELAGCSKKNFLIRKAIMGDASDNIVGVKGTKEGTIDPFFAELDGDLGDHPYERMFLAAQQHKSSRVKAIAQSLDIILRNIKLMDISQEQFTDDEVARCIDLASRPTSLDVVAVKKMFEGFEFNSLINDFNSWITRFQLLH